MSPVPVFQSRSVWRAAGFFPKPRESLALLLGTVGRGFGQAGLATIGGILAIRLVSERAAVQPNRQGLVDSAASLSLLQLALLSAIAIAIKTSASAVLAHAGRTMVGKMGARLRGAVLRGLMLVTIERHSLHGPRHQDHGPNAPRPGQALGALTDHLREAEDGLGAGVKWLSACVELLFLVLALLGTSMPLTGFSLGFFLLLAYPIARARKRLRTKMQTTALQQAAVLERVHETVNALDLLRATGAAERTASRLEQLTLELTRGEAWIALRTALLSGANELAAACALVAMIGISQGHASHVLLRFFITMVLCYKPLRDLSDARSAIERGEIAAEALATYLPNAAAAHPPHDEPASKVQWQRGALELHDLQTRAQTWSLRLEPGSKLILRGATGSGKTTLLRTLLGLAPPISGRVTYGRTELEGEQARRGPGPHARPFAWLPQELPVLIGSVRDNIRPQDDAPVRSNVEPLTGRLGVPEAPGGGDVNGLEVDLTMRQLSGGERQLLGLARALESDAPVLLLDEPTAALDAETKSRVLEILRADPRSMIIASHDPDVDAIGTHKAAPTSSGTMVSVPIAPQTQVHSRAS